MSAEYSFASAARLHGPNNLIDVLDDALIAVKLACMNAANKLEKIEYDAGVAPALALATLANKLEDQRIEMLNVYGRFKQPMIGHSPMP